MDVVTLTQITCTHYIQWNVLLLSAFRQLVKTNKSTKQITVCEQLAHSGEEYKILHPVSVASETPN